MTNQGAHKQIHHHKPLDTLREKFKERCYKVEVNWKREIISLVSLPRGQTHWSLSSAWPLACENFSLLWASPKPPGS